MPDNKDPELPQRSWLTRMESVIRQFNKLAEEQVTDEASGNLVRVVGLCIVNDRTRITVLPIDVPEPVYSTDVEGLRLWR